MGLKWLVTGGCGFIGTALVRRLHTDDSEFVRIVDNLSVGTKGDLGRVAPYIEIDRSRLREEPWRSDVAQLIVGDVRDERLGGDAARGADVIVHLAANTGVAQSIEDPRTDCTTNTIGTLNYLEAARARGVKRFVFASSGASVGEVVPPIHEEVVPHPVSPYGASKLAGEGYCSVYANTYGVETVALRFGNVYGPGSSRKSSVVATFIDRALRGQPLEIFGDGRQTRDFVFVEDLVDAIMLAASTPGVGGHVFQIANSAETAVNELAEMLMSVLSGLGLSDVTLKHAAPRLGDVRRNYSDTSKAHSMLGWRATTDLKEGLRATVSSFLPAGTAVRS